MTTTCHIQLFDTLQLTPAGQATPLDIRSAKLRPLLAYLIVHHGQPVNRQRLAAILWPESTDATGRRNLREYLYRARQTLEQFAPEHPLLSSDEQAVSLTLPENCTVDLFEFRQKLRQAAASQIAARKLQLLAEAHALYKNDLLREFYDDWAEQEREQTRQTYEESLSQLAELYQAQGQYEQALTAAQQALAQDPLREEHHRRLMTLHALNGEPSLAIQQFKTLKTHLAQELAIEPTAETTQLANAITSGRFQPPPTFPPNPPARTHFTQFIGRQAELAQLNLLFEQRVHTASAAIHTIIVQGDSGVGKTRLIRQWLTQTADRATLLEGRSHEFETTIPYRPLLDALQRILPHIPWHMLPSAARYTWLAPLAQLLPDIHTHLPDLPPAPINPDEDIGHIHIMEGITHILLTLAHQRPLILFLDDLHWADMATWRFLTFLARRLTGKPILLVCTFSNSEATANARQRRHTLQKDPHTHTIPLARLWPNDTAQLISHTLTADITDAQIFAQRLHQMTEGNPFFATEILRALTESDLPQPYTAASLDQLTLPDAIQTLIQGRLERLGRESRQLLSIAAAVRREFSFDFLRDIIPPLNEVSEEMVLDYLEEWLERGLIVEQPEGYDFSHQQIRTVAYNLLSRPRRRIIHRQIALALEQHDPSAVERIARHYTLSDQPTQAIPSLLAAGQRAVNIRSYQEAQLIGRTLLDILQHPTADASTLSHQQQLAAAYGFSGETDQALAVLHAVVTLAEQEGDTPAAGQAQLKIAQLHWLRGEVRQARPAAEQALTLLNNGPEHGAVLRLLGRINIAQGRFAQAKPYLLEALTFLDRPDPASRLGRATMLGYLITAYGHLGEATQTRETWAEIEQLALVVESPAVFAVVHTQTAVALNALDLWTEAEPIAQKGLQACEAYNLPVYAFVAKSVLGRVAYFLGRVSEAYTLLHAAIAWAEAHHYTLFRYMAHVYLAEIARHNTDTSTFEAQIKTAAQLAQQTDNQWAQEQVLALQNRTI